MWPCYNSNIFYSQVISYYLKKKLDCIMEHKVVEYGKLIVQYNICPAANVMRDTYGKDW